jgi:DNA-binding MarR family transcriptional regulator
MYFYHLAYQLKRAEHTLALALEKAVSPLGITLAQANVLLFIDRFPGATLTQLARVAAVATPTMHRTIVTLQKKQLLRRTSKPGDDKSQLVTLTPEGKSLLEKAQLELMQTQERAKLFLAEDELDELQRLLRLYEDAFSQKRETKRKAKENEATKSNQE